ncbi:reverse transcriptase domain-containing protein [Tanacetum coccineum]
MGVENLQENVDSRLVANQVNGTYVAKETDMIRYMEKVKTLNSSFKAFSIKQVPRSENKKVDALSKIASTSFAHLSKQVPMEELKEKSINAAEVLAVVEEEGDTWMTPIFKYLSDGTLSAKGKKARAVKHKSWRFSIINGILYKKSFLGPWLHCVGPLQANYVLREIHEGSCNMHTIRRGKGLADWLLLANHAQGRKKVNSSMSRLPSSQACPKEPSTKVKPNHISMAILQVGFGLPGEIVSDNGKQFQDNPFNDCIGEGIKARLDERSKNWMEELPRVLWAHRTMIKSSNGDTPFSLTYRTEAIILAEIGMPTLRIAEINLEKNKEAL